MTGPRALASASGQAPAALARRVGVGPTQLTANCKAIRHRLEPGSRLLWLLRCPSLRALQTSMFPILGTYCAYWACFWGCQVCTVCAEYAPGRWNSPVRPARADPRCRFLYRTRPLGTLTRSVSEGVEPLPRLHLASVVPPSRKVTVPPDATLAATLATKGCQAPFGVARHHRLGLPDTQGCSVPRSRYAPPDCPG